MDTREKAEALIAWLVDDDQSLQKIYKRGLGKLEVL